MNTALQSGRSTCSGRSPIHPCPLPLMGCCASHTQPVARRSQHLPTPTQDPPLCEKCKIKPRVVPGGSCNQRLCADCYDKYNGILSDVFCDVAEER